MPPVLPVSLDAGALVARARRFGPLAYRELGRRPLAPGGVPAEEVGKALASHLDRWWQRMAAPDPFVVVLEGSEGDGLVTGMTGAAPDCAPALRVVVVEPDEAARARLASVLPLEPPEQALGPLGPGEDPDDEPVVLPGRGPLVSALASVPSVPGPSLRLAVRWLSTLPADLWEWRNGQWSEVRLASPAAVPAAILGRAGEEGTLTEVLVPGRGPVEGETVPEGGRVFSYGPALEWLRDAQAGDDGGLVVIVDYLAERTADLVGNPPRRGVALDQVDPRAMGRRRYDEVLSPLIVLEFE